MFTEIEIQMGKSLHLFADGMMRLISKGFSEHNLQEQNRILLYMEQWLWFTDGIAVLIRAAPILHKEGKRKVLWHPV